MVDEEDLASFADREMRGFSRARGEGLDRLTADADQHPAPVVFARQPQDGRPEHIVLPAVGVGEKAAALQRIGEPEDAARVDAESLRQARQRHRLRRSRHRFQERQGAFEALHHRRLERPFSYSLPFLCRAHFACSPCSA